MKYDLYLKFTGAELEAISLVRLIAAFLKVPYSAPYTTQRYFTRIAFRKCFVGPLSPSYDEGLKIFGLKPLEHRQVEFNLILCYKIVEGFSHIRFDELFSWARTQVCRSNSFQLARETYRSNAVFNSFSFRVVRSWNLLHQRIVDVPGPCVFFSKLFRGFDLHDIVSPVY